MLTLSREQLDSLKAIAERHNMRVLVTKNQVGIGPSGEPWFEVVYSPARRLKWDLRNRTGRNELREQMAAVLA